jgi:hypothetical protein
MSAENSINVLDIPPEEWTRALSSFQLENFPASRDLTIFPLQILSLDPHNVPEHLVTMYIQFLIQSDDYDIDQLRFCRDNVSQIPILNKRKNFFQKMKEIFSPNVQALITLPTRNSYEKLIVICHYISSGKYSFSEQEQEKIFHSIYNLLTFKLRNLSAEPGETTYEKLIPKFPKLSEDGFLKRITRITDLVLDNTLMTSFGTIGLISLLLDVTTFMYLGTALAIVGSVDYYFVRNISPQESKTTLTDEIHRVSRELDEQLLQDSEFQDDLQPPRGLGL